MFVYVLAAGESNVGYYATYGCAIQQMVWYWRRGWGINSPSMDQQYPFGFVQVHLFYYSKILD